MPLNSKTFAEAFTFTRSAIGTYFGADGELKTAAINEPRFEFDPDTGERWGLLLERQSTNLQISSEDTSGWNKDGMTRVASDELSPDGVSIADTFYETATTEQHRFKRTLPTLIADTDYTVSCFVKPKGPTTRGLSIAIYSSAIGQTVASVRWDLSNGEVTPAVTGGDSFTGASAIKCANGWWRVSCSFNDPSTAIIAIMTATDGGVTVYAGNAAVGFAAWGWQIEELPFPTSYIKTDGATITRTPDALSVNNYANWYNESVFSVFCEFRPFSRGRLVGFLANPTIFSFQGATGSDRLSMEIETDAARVQLVIGKSGVGVLGINAGSDTALASTKHKAVCVFNRTAGVVKHAIDGSAVVANVNAATFFPEATSLNIGRQLSGSPIDGHIVDFRMFPFSLTDAEIQAMTA